MKIIEKKIIGVLNKWSTLTAFHIAKKIGVSKTEINILLYSKKDELFKIDKNLKWSIFKTSSDTKKSIKQNKSSIGVKKSIKQKNINDTFKLFDIDLNVFKKEMIELSYELISNKIQFNYQKIDNNILDKKINLTEYREIINHMKKKGYKYLRNKNK